MIFYLSFSFVGTTESVRLTPQMKDFIAYRTSGKWKQLARVLSSDNDIDIIIEQIEHDCRKSMYDQSYKMIAKLIERRSHVEWEFFKNGLMIIKADGIVDDFEKQFITNNRGIYFFSNYVFCYLYRTIIVWNARWCLDLRDVLRGLTIWIWYT